MKLKFMAANKNVQKSTHKFIYIYIETAICILMKIVWNTDQNYEYVTVQK